MLPSSPSCLSVADQAGAAVLVPGRGFHQRSLPSALLGLRACGLPSQPVMVIYTTLWPLSPYLIMFWAGAIITLQLLCEAVGPSCSPTSTLWSRIAMHHPPHRVQNLHVVLPGEGRVPERSAHPPPVPGLCPWYQWPLLEPAWGSCSRVAVLSGRRRCPQWGWARDGLGCSWLCSRVVVSDLALGYFHVLCIQLPTVEVTPSYPTCPSGPLGLLVWSSAAKTWLCQRLRCATSVLGVSGGLCWAPGGFALSLPS